LDLLTGTPGEHTSQHHPNLYNEYTRNFAYIIISFHFYIYTNTSHISLTSLSFSLTHYNIQALISDSTSDSRDLDMAPELVPASVEPPTKTVTMPSRAFVTFLAGNGDYVKGVVGLAKGLRKAKTAYPLVVAVLPDVPEEHRRILVSQGCIVREIVPVYPPDNQTPFAMAYYVINYSKLRIWEVRERYY
jgi:hypothetical protein